MRVRRVDSGLDMSLLLLLLSDLIDRASRPHDEEDEADDAFVPSMTPSDMPDMPDMPAKLKSRVGVTTSVVGVSKLATVLAWQVVVVVEAVVAVSLLALFLRHMALWASRMNSSCSFCCWSFAISWSRVAFFSSQSSVSCAKKWTKRKEERLVTGCKMANYGQYGESGAEG